MNGAFNGQILTEKLSKLNNSQQSIETLSHWCIFHRKNAKQVVDTWDRQFHCAPREQRISFLYLANDILQNSRRKGSEFVGEFWKVLPGALRDVFDKGDENGRNVAMRLVNIWEERKVFGSRGQILKEDLVGRSSHIPLENNTNNGRNLHSVKEKSVVGGRLEKIISAYEKVNNHHSEEDAALANCKAAVTCVENTEKDLQNGCNIGTSEESRIIEELREKGSILRRCIDQLEASETTRIALISVLREALHEEESKLEQVRTQLQVAHHRSEQASNICQQVLNNQNRGQMQPSQVLSDAKMYHNLPINLLQDTSAQGNESQPVPVSTVKSITTSLDSTSQVDEDHKKAAAAVAAKLAASTSSAQMLSFVLSSLASEAASNSSVLRTSTAPVLSADYHAEKRQKSEHNISGPEENISFMAHPPTNNSPRLQVGSMPQQLSPVQQHQVSSMQQHQASPNFQQQAVNIPQHQTSPSNFQHQSVNMQHQASPSTIQHQTPSSVLQQHQASSPMHNEDASPPPHQLSPMQPQPPPPPPLPPQYVQGVGTMTGNHPYPYGASGPQRPPPFQGYPLMGVPHQGMPQYSTAPNPYQLYQSSEVHFYHQPPLPTTPSISRQ